MPTLSELELRAALADDRVAGHLRALMRHNRKAAKNQLELAAILKDMAADVGEMTSVGQGTGAAARALEFWIACGTGALEPDAPPVSRWQRFRSWLAM